MLQGWLRDVYDIYIDINTIIDEYTIVDDNEMELVTSIVFKFKILKYELDNHSSIEHSHMEYKTYEEALEEALYEALKMIKIK